MIYWGWIAPLNTWDQNEPVTSEGNISFSPLAALPKMPMTSLLSATRTLLLIASLSHG